MEKFINHSETLDIVNLKEKLKKLGYLYLKNIFDPFSLVQEFGKLIPQYDGKIIWDIKAEKKYENVYHSLNKVKLYPHTECYEFQTMPPKYLCLWCEKPNTCEGGHTTILDALDYFKNLQKKEIDHLKSKSFNFSASKGIQKSGKQFIAENKFIDLDKYESEMIRFSYNNVDFKNDMLTKQICEKFLEHFEKEFISFKWEKNDFLIWDNHRMVHSRTQYEDNSRLLKRVWLKN